jgi:hypothetical protein
LGDALIAAMFGVVQADAKQDDGAERERERALAQVKVCPWHPRPPPVSAEPADHARVGVWAQAELSKRRRPGMGLSKGHVVLLSALGLALGLAWPWLRTLPPVAAALVSAHHAWTTMAAEASPFLTALSKRFARGPAAAA